MHLRLRRWEGGASRAGHTSTVGEDERRGIDDLAAVAQAEAQPAGGHLDRQKLCAELQAPYLDTCRRAEALEAGGSGTVLLLKISLRRARLSQL